MCITKRVNVETKVLSKNDEAAAANRALFLERGVVAVNFMSAPGAGKTSLLEATLRRLDRAAAARIAVIEGDLETEYDADRIRALGVRAHQIVTGTVCHLDARMVAHALSHFPIETANLLLIENVGNMVCPAEFDLGEQLRVMVYSVPEGAEKPKKYPLMFHQAHAVLLNKIDLAPYCGVALDDLVGNVRDVNPSAKIFALSCRTGEGVAAWVEWFEQAVAAQRAGVRACV
ncbi:MAG: hydrogenase nickel incorporation protein HypB [Bryobacterales bacterium]|nr:hydrogenase nickel incorporation protein HypB [Bryobacterales bacterium]